MAGRVAPEDSLNWGSCTLNSVKILAISDYFVPLQRYAFLDYLQITTFTPVIHFAKKIVYGIWNVVLYPCRVVSYCVSSPSTFLQREQWYRHVFWLARWFWSPIILYGMGFGLDLSGFKH